MIFWEDEPPKLEARWTFWTVLIHVLQEWRGKRP